MFAVRFHCFQYGVNPRLEHTGGLFILSGSAKSEGLDDPYECTHIMCGVKMKNITLSIDEQVLQAGREYARQHNVSFNVLVRRLIEQTVVQKQNRWLDDTFSLMDKANVSSSGENWNREDLYRV